MVFAPMALCPINVIGKNEWYRLFTSEITHGSLQHILSNMVVFILWGTGLEQHFGTILYAVLNLVIGIISNLISLGLQYGLADYMPDYAESLKPKVDPAEAAATEAAADHGPMSTTGQQNPFMKFAAVFSGGQQQKYNCGVGYSNILFGLMMLETWVKTDEDHPKQSVFGLFKVRKIFVPWLMMLFIQIAVPEASFIGHLSGIIAALLIRCLFFKNVEALGGLQPRK